MAKKPPPKYPHKGRLIRKRLISQALLILAAVGVIGFYFYMHSTDLDPNGTLYRLGQSLVGTKAKQEAPDSSGQTPAQPSAPPSPSAASPKEPPAQQPSKAFYSAPVNASVATAPTKTPPLYEAPPAPEAEPALPAEKETDRPQTPSASPDDARGDMPFDGLGIEEVTAELTRKYAGNPAGKWGERVAGVVTRLDLAEQRPDDGEPAKLVLALTFDACGGGKDGYDSELIEYLRDNQIPATLFVTSLWMRKHPEELKALAADPLFEIAAHGERHRPCSVDGKSVYGIKGTASMAELVREVLGNAREIERATGKSPLWFRSGTAFYDELAVEAIQDMGMGVAGYSIAGDQGATLPASRVAAQALKAKNGDILLFHMNKPRSGTREGIKRAIPVLLEKGAVFVRLSDKM